MKKVFALFLSFFTMPAMASGIDATSASASCTNNTLETYSGNTNLQADWQPNTIDIRWYNMNTQVTPTNAIANTCVYDSTLSIPSNTPSRIGYTFAGWEVVPQYDFSTLPTETNGIHAWSRNSPTSSCWYGAGTTSRAPCDNGDFDDLNYYEWKVSFDYGMIYGTILCSSTGGQGDTAGHPNESSNGSYCWCKATGFIPTNSNIKYVPTKSPVLAFIRNFNEYITCIENCADWCSAYLVTHGPLRRSMFN